MEATTTRLNEIFGLGKDEDGVAGEVLVDNDGWISFGSRTLTQGEAIDIATHLVIAVQASQNRSQIDAPAFYDTAAIIRRTEGPLGRAIASLRHVL